MINIKFFKTTEISEELWSELLILHNNIFNVNIEIDNFIQYYKNTELGYCYHSIAFFENLIIGHTTLKPQFYEYKNQIIKGVLSGSSFIHVDYRKNIFLYLDMYEEIKKNIIQNNYKFSIGVPNANSFEYATTIMDNIYLGDLNYYYIPVFNNSLINKFVFYVLKWKNLFISQNRLDREKLHIVKNSKYVESRYNFDYYKKISNEYGLFIFRIVSEGKFRILYILEYINFVDSIDIYYFAKELKNVKFDFAFYIGVNNKLRMGIKIPNKFIPKKLPLVLDLFNNSEPAEKEILKNIQNWDFDLSNFDVR